MTSKKWLNKKVIIAVIAVAITLAMSLQLVFTSVNTKAASNEDVDPPEISKIEVSPTDVVIGDSIYVYVYASDASGLYKKPGEVHLQRDPDKTYDRTIEEEAQLKPTSSTGKYVAEFKTSDSWYEGIYHVDYVFITDSKINSTSVTPYKQAKLLPTVDIIVRAMQEEPTTKKEEPTTKKEEPTTKKQDEVSTKKSDESSTPESPKLNGVVKGKDGRWGYYLNDYLQADYNGFQSNEFGYWYIENGYVDFDKNDILKDGSGNWWKVVNGKIDFNAIGVFKNSYGWWKVKNGYVDFDYTGVAKNEYGWWRIENGKVNFKANGVYKNEYGWWKVEKGKVNFNYTGVAKNDYGWWRIEKGKVNFKFTGIAKNEYGTWYVNKGKVDFHKNGKVKYDGKTYKVTNGKAKLA